MISKENAKQQIKGLIDKYNKVVGEGRLAKYTEEETKKDFILPMFEALGWNVHDSSEVSAEETITGKRVDYGFRINGIPKFFLEAKKMSADLNKPEYAQQTINYAHHKSCTWAVLTDFDDGVKIYNAEWKTADLQQAQFLTIPREEFLGRFDDLWLLSRESFEKGLIDQVAERYGKKAKKTPVGEQLFLDLTVWREKLSKDILGRNKERNLSETELDESVQRIIDRLIFIRNCEDRGLEPPTLMPKVMEWESRGRGALGDLLKEVYRDFDKQYNSKLFEEHLCDQLEVTNQTLGEVIRGLYHTKDGMINYDFSALDADVLGNVYEQYLGHILKKTAKRATITEKHAKRKEQGIYYTPTYIVDYIVRNTVGKLLEDSNVDVEKIRVLDPACGSGSFLIKTFDVVNEYYSKTGKDLGQTKLDLKTGLPYTRKVKILHDNIFGVDLDPQAVEIAQLNLMLKIAEKGQRLPLLQRNIKCGNSLIDDEKVAGDKALKWEGPDGYPKIMASGGFDVVIGNPPYVRIQTLDTQSVEFFNSRYKSATKNYDIYALFVEKGLSLLKEGGILGFILPSKFFNADYGKGLRKIIAENKLLYKIVDFKDFQVFEGATTYTCLLFLKKAKNKNFDYFELADKTKLFQTKNLWLDIFKTSKQEPPKSVESWNFISEDSKELIAKLDEIKLRLGDVSKHIFQGLVTGADKLYFVNMVEDRGDIVKIRNNFDKKEYFIEKRILKKLLKGKEIRRWGIDWQKIYIVYPYEVKPTGAKLISLEGIKADYPRAYQYFLNYEKELKGREDNRFKNEKNWHQFGRLQNIEKFEQSKIMTQVLASKNSFTFDEKGEYYFVGGGNAGGYGIVLKDEYSKDYHVILALLNSKLLELYLKKISTPFRGGFYSYGKRFIEKLPIIIPLGGDKNRLVELSKKQLERNKRLNEIGDKKTDERQRIEEEIKKTDAEIDELVYKLYGITEEEKRIIEESLK